MVSDYRNLHAVHAINRYLWSRIGPTPGTGILAPINYQGVSITPIVPVEETPTLLTAIESQTGIKSVPFIVYNWTKIDSGQTWMIETNEIAYSLRSADDKAMRQMINLFDDEFKDYDLAAQRVNDYLFTNGSDALRQFDFKYIRVSSLGGQMPVTEENDQNEAIVSISATFTRSSR